MGTWWNGVCGFIWVEMGWPTQLETWGYLWKKGAKFGLLTIFFHYFKYSRTPRVSYSIISKPSSFGPNIRNSRSPTVLKFAGCYKELPGPQVDWPRLLKNHPGKSLKNQPEKTVLVSPPHSRSKLKFIKNRKNHILWRPIKRSSKHSYYFFPLWNSKRIFIIKFGKNYFCFSFCQSLCFTIFLKAICDKVNFLFIFHVSRESREKLQNSKIENWNFPP